MRNEIKIGMLRENARFSKDNLVALLRRLPIDFLTVGEKEDPYQLSGVKEVYGLMVIDHYDSGIEITPSEGNILSRAIVEDSEFPFRFEQLMDAHTFVTERCVIVPRISDLDRIGKNELDGSWLGLRLFPRGTYKSPEETIRIEIYKKFRG